MFKNAARAGLANRLAARQGFHPALATVVAAACYPSRDIALPIPALRTGRAACDSVRRYERLGWSQDMVLAGLFGDDALEQLHAYARAAESAVEDTDGADTR